MWPVLITELTCGSVLSEVLCHSKSLIFMLEPQFLGRMMQLLIALCLFFGGE